MHKETSNKTFHIIKDITDVEMTGYNLAKSVNGLDDIHRIIDNLYQHVFA